MTFVWLAVTVIVTVRAVRAWDRAKEWAHLHRIDRMNRETGGGN